MNVILLEKVSNLGDLGIVVSVKSGYARNFLIPQGKAKPATKENIEIFEAKRAELEKQALDILKEAQELHEKINGKVVSIVSPAGEEGKLFGSIGTQDISEALQKIGFEIERSQIRLSEGTLRHTGTFEIKVQLHSSIVADITVDIQAEES